VSRSKHAKAVVDRSSDHFAPQLRSM